jgi:hypothetical protein
MKLHYKKLFVLSLLLAAMIGFLPVVFYYESFYLDPLDQARGDQERIKEYINESLDLIKKNTADESNRGNLEPELVKEIESYLAAAKVKLNDQERSLNALGARDRGPDISSIQAIIATCVGLVGTISSILLSWRQDAREYRAELQKIDVQTSKIIVP